MWAYLFWTVVIAWLFTLRPKRESISDSDVGPIPASQVSDDTPHHQQAQCSHTCCHAHSHGQRQGASLPTGHNPNANPEIRTPQRELGVERERESDENSWAERSPYGTVSEKSASTLKDGIHGRRQRGLPPHLSLPSSTRPFTGSARSVRGQSVSPSTRGQGLACKTCGKEYERWIDLQKHIKQARHAVYRDGSVQDSHTSRRSTSGFFRCELCERGMDNLHNLQMHQWTKHGIKLPTEDGSPMKEEPVRMAVSAEVCDMCECSFDDGFQLRQHKGVHHMWSLFCAACQQPLDGTGGALEHYKARHGVKNINPQRIQAHLDNLWSQQDVSGTSQRVYSCEKCGQDYATKVELNTHYEECTVQSVPQGWRAVTPPRLDFNSINTAQQLPSFGIPSEESEAISRLESESLAQESESAPTSDLSEALIASAYARRRAEAQRPAENDTPSADPSSSSSSDDDLVTPHHSILLVKPRPYIPAKVGDIETQLPSFDMAPSGMDQDSFPPIAPGPLPALAKAPVSAWSKPFAPKAEMPPGRPLDEPVKRFSPAVVHSDTTTSASLQNSVDRAWPRRSQNETESGRWSSPPQQVTTASTRKSWAERALPAPKRGLGFDTAAYRARYADRNTASPEPEPKHGLEPIYDNNDWEVLAPPPAPKVAEPSRTLAQNQALRAQEEAKARWAQEAEERRQITEAQLAAGEEDPYGGW